MTLRDFVDVASWAISDRDRELFERQIGDFVPPDAFDAHAHWYDCRHIVENDPPIESPEVGYQAMLASMQRWMGKRTIRQGLYFAYPTANVDCAAANRFVADQVRPHDGCRGLMLIRPGDDPSVVEALLQEHGFAGFKVYHVFAERADTFNAGQGEFLPEWAWEIADRRGLWITMHMVFPKALADPRNVTYIQDHCRRWPGANLVLAHAARGFNAAHTVQAIDALRGIDNVFFDTSAICEPASFEAILRATGTTRLMYGSDFPVSELRGKAISLGDGFFWMYRNNVDLQTWPHGGLTLVGIESLLALKQACRTLALVDRDVERIFSVNARQLLGIHPKPDHSMVNRQYEQAKQCIPGGTQLLSKRPEMFAPNHWPAYYEQAIGCEVIDTSGRRFIDMSSSGILACILGFADPDVNAAVIRRVQLGSMATQQTYDEVRLAERLTEIHPWADMARFTRSGGEAATVAVRIARASTGRDKVAICGYHGWHDWYLAANLSDDDTLDGHLLPGLQASGVPRSLGGTTLAFAYNALDELDSIIAVHGDDLAAIVMEPTRHHDPEPGFLQGVRDRAFQVGARLIFDEISIGWRLCFGGAHLQFGVEPDLAIFAKGLSNGFAMGAVIGNRNTMLAAQDTFVSSTYWTEGVGPAAALATVDKLGSIDAPRHLAKMGRTMSEGWRDLGRQFSVPTTVSGRPEMVHLGLDHPDANELITLFTIRMLDHGFLAAGSFNPTMAHQPIHVERYLAAARNVFGELAEAIDRSDVMDRINACPKHTSFQRLVN